MAGALEALERRYRVPGWRAVAWLSILTIAAFLGWIAIAKVDEVAVAAGEVVPQGRVKLIQHLEGGIVRELFVTDGDTVSEGDPLVQLDLAPSEANADELRIRIDGLELVRARLKAEVEGARQPTFPEDLARRYPAIVTTER